MNRTTSRAAPWFSGETFLTFDGIRMRVASRPSRSTINRWFKGVRGVRLRAVPLGPGRTGTTAEELERFLAALATIRGMDVA